MAELKLPSSTQVDNTNVELALVKAELQSIKNQLAAVLNVNVGNLPESYAVVDSEARAELAAIKAQLAALSVSISNFPAVQDVQLTGSNLTQYCLSEETRPAADSVPAGTFSMIYGDFGSLRQSDGTNWVVMQ